MYHDSLSARSTQLKLQHTLGSDSYPVIQEENTTINPSRAAVTLDLIRSEIVGYISYCMS